MAKLSPMRAGVQPLDHMKLLSRGKVRNTYRPPAHPELLLAEATNGISIFDFVLNALVPTKGIVLNCMNHFWCKYLEKFGISTHLVAAGAAIDEYLPTLSRGNKDLQSQAIVIRKMQMVPVEFIYRSVLTGSSVSSYKKDGTVCNHRLPPGLQDSDPLPCILDTPTTKAQEGHDENIDFLMIRDNYPRQTMLGSQIFQIGSSYCESRGIKLADSKFEFGVDGIIGDEILTPDSSRFWELKVWQEGRTKEVRKAPPPYDKQFVRGWGVEQGINKRDPKKDDDVAWVHSLEVPQLLIEQTTQLYRYIFWRLTSQKIENYLMSRMGVDLPAQPPKKILVLLGSKSDEYVLNSIPTNRPWGYSKLVAHAMSCHRNTDELIDFVRSPKFAAADAVICAGGKALALPGMVDALAVKNQKQIPVIGVALGEPGTKSLAAAKLSIEELPGAPVIINEMTGEAYCGPDGFVEALDRVADGELPPMKPRVHKPVEMNLYGSSLE